MATYSKQKIAINLYLGKARRWQAGGFGPTDIIPKRVRVRCIQPKKDKYHKIVIFFTAVS